MRETGLVVKTENGRAVVKVDKKDECSKCGMCLFPKNANSIEFSANNSVGAKEGDAVIIETKENGKLLGAILAFFVPLLLIVAAAVFSLVVIKREIYTLIIGVAAVVIWYAILPLIDKRLKKSDKFSPDVISVVKTTDDN